MLQVWLTNNWTNTYVIESAAAGASIYTNSNVQNWNCSTMVFCSIAKMDCYFGWGFSRSDFADRFCYKSEIEK